jgi:hypothetical protein
MITAPGATGVARPTAASRWLNCGKVLVMSTRGVRGRNRATRGRRRRGGLATVGWFGGKKNGGVLALIAALVIAVGDGRPLQHQGG